MTKTLLQQAATAIENRALEAHIWNATTPQSGNFTKAKGVGATFKKQMDLVKAAVYALPAGKVQTLVDSDTSITYRSYQLSFGRLVAMTRAAGPVGSDSDLIKNDLGSVEMA